MLTGCAQDLIFSDINRDTVEVLARNGCEVITPPEQRCCGSLHAHNGEWALAQQLARKKIDQFPPGAVRCHHHQRRRLRLASQALSQTPRRRPQLSRKRKTLGPQDTRYPRVADPNRHQAPLRRRDHMHRHLPRVLSPGSRAEDHRSTSATPPDHPESEPGRIGRKHVVLRQRRRL